MDIAFSTKCDRKKTGKKLAQIPFSIAHTPDEIERWIEKEKPNDSATKLTCFVKAKSGTETKS